MRGSRGSEEEQEGVFLRGRRVWEMFVLQYDLPAGFYWKQVQSCSRPTSGHSPLEGLSIFSLSLWVRRLGPLPTNRRMQRKFSSRIVWNGMIGIISGRRRNGSGFNTTAINYGFHITSLHASCLYKCYNRR